MRSLVFAAFAVFALGAPAMAQAPGAMMRFDGTLLSVSADADVKAPPDTATLNAGVTTNAKTAEAAMADNAAKMNAVMTALRRAGIAEKDVQTSGLSLNPQYVYNQNEPPKLTGYDATNTVTAKVRNLKNVGKAIDAIVSVGSNQINGVSFSIDEPDALLDNARRAAMKNASARAQLYAYATGLKVARIVSISESGAAPPVVPMPIAYARAEMKVATPVAPGELTLTAHVDVTYELK